MKFYTLLLALFLTCSVQAQETFKIDGIVTDTLDNSLIAATVMLMDPDSTLVDFRTTELDGSFRFTKVAAGDYIVKSTYIGYIPLTQNVSSTGENIDLGKMEMKEMAEELMEVVIKAAKAQIKMRGDTIEYDVSTFKVPPGATVESLLKRLPGIELDKDGTILSEGKNVSDVTVDGKKFFSNDPKVAIKNLPAEGISKIQVFDKKTEEEKTTGIKTESENKTMNLALKEDFKKGAFGQVVAGVGTKSGGIIGESQYRAELKGNLNRFNKDMQFSIIGVGNNTGRNGLGWNDYQDFMGSNSFNFNRQDQFGFGGGGGMFFMTFGGGSSNNIEQSIQSIFFNSRNDGFPENYNGGVNFNYDKDKTKLNAVYFINVPKLTSSSTSESENFLASSTFNRDRNNFNVSRSLGHRAELSWKQELDSLHTITVDVNGAFINDKNNNDIELSLTNDGTLKTKSKTKTYNKNVGNLVTSMVTFRKKFMKPGRRFGANVSYLNTEMNRSETQNTAIDNYNNGLIKNTEAIVQNSNGQETKKQYKANAVFVEPLSKKLFSQTFYNFSNREETGDREVKDNSNAIIDNLSRTYNNTIQNHRIGSAIRYASKGYNVSVGLGYQMFYLKGDYAIKNGTSNRIDKQYNSIIPHFNLSVSPKRGTRYGIGYSLNNVEPSIDRLQPIVDNRNPLFITEGNPNLTPESEHKISANWNKFWALSRTRIGIRGSYSYFSNNIITNQRVDDRLATYVTYQNYKGGNAVSLNSWFSFPVYKTFIKGRGNLWGRYRKSFAYVNDQLNKTNNWNISPSLKFTIIPWKGGSIDIGGRWGYTLAQYDLNTTQDQVGWDNTYSIDFDTKIVPNLFFNSEFSYETITNKRFNLNQRIPTLNASIYRQFLEGNKAEVRLSLYNAFNQDYSVSQYAGQYSVSKSRRASLGRYVMLSMKYNIRGLNGNKKGMFH